MDILNNSHSILNFLFSIGTELIYILQIQQHIFKKEYIMINWDLSLEYKDGWTNANQLSILFCLSTLQEYYFN